MKASKILIRKNKAKDNTVINIITRNRLKNLGAYMERHVDGSVYQTTSLKKCNIELPHKNNLKDYDCYEQGIFQRSSFTDSGKYEKAYYAVKKSDK